MSGSQDRIYLDYAASTPLRPEVVEAMLPWLSGKAYNASSLHSEGRAAKAALDEARRRVAACIGASAKEIVFTGGGSEADNLALFGSVHAAPGGRGVAYSAIEHHAVLHSAHVIASLGAPCSVVPVNADGLVSPDELSRALAERPASLVSIMYVNNELGTIEPVRELAAVAHEGGALFHTDAVQAALTQPIDVDTLGADLLSLAAHKISGPKGTGALFVREDIPLRPMLYGGSQEYAKRAGTENLAGIAGFAEALGLAVRERDETAARLRALQMEFERRLAASVEGIRVNGAAAPRAPHISNVSFRGLRSDALLIRLDLDGVAVSAGSACASGAPEPSHVIAALGIGPEWQDGTVRFSFGRETTLDEIVRAAGKTAAAVESVRGSSACF